MILTRLKTKQSIFGLGQIIGNTWSDIKLIVIMEEI